MIKENMKQQKTKEFITKEMLEKEDITFLFEYNGHIKTYDQVRKYSILEKHIPNLVLDNQYTFIIEELVYKQTTKPFLWWNKVVETDEIDYRYNDELDLYIEGETFKTLLLDYLDKKEAAYQLKLALEKKDKLETEIKNIEYRDKLLNKND